ncbi:MAG TPA: (Fe-S)-binding protein [Saprospiraceae bacterium]|nr:(Fe-S)-binding protein [Saprospiraceae bacterium]
MTVGLFIPCYIDQFYPQVGIASLELLEKLGCEVVVPAGQTCCGQPMANTGCEQDARKNYTYFVEQYKDFDHIVMPSGSCTYHVRKHYDIIEQNEDVRRVRQNTYDISEFLLDVLKIKSLDSQFPHTVGLHQSCHGLRGLRLGTGTERVLPQESKLKQLLGMVKDLQLVALERADECCGFGGTFAINEPDISVRMGLDRIAEHEAQKVEVITAGDMSCLMHLEGLLKRQKKPIVVKHLVEILNHTEP